MMQTENNQNIFNRSDSLTLEEIQASTDLSGKIASASALANVPRVIEVQSTNDYVTIVYQFVVSLGGKEFGIINFTSSQEIAKWTKIFNGLPYGTTREFYDQTGTYIFQRHANKGIQTSCVLPAGSYVIVF